MKITKRTGSNTWVTMGPVGWGCSGCLALILGAAVLLWPEVLLTSLFPRNDFWAVVGWVLTVVWLLLLGAGAVIAFMAKQKDD